MRAGGEVTGGRRESGAEDEQEMQQELGYGGDRGAEDAGNAGAPVQTRGVWGAGADIRGDHATLRNLGACFGGGCSGDIGDNPVHELAEERLLVWDEAW